MGSLGKIVVELVSGFCNAKCVWCANSYKSTASRIKNGFMDYDSFKHFVDINPVQKIIPFSLGESLLHPHFAECMSYARDKGFIFKSLHSNFGMEISDRTLEELTNFETITINIGGGLNATHELNMGTDLDVVIDNAMRLCEFKRKNNSKVTLKAKMLINKNNQGEKEVIKIRFDFMDSIEPFDTLFFGCSDGSETDKKEWLRNNYDTSIKIREKMSIENEELKISIRSKCFGLIPTIRCNGDVNVCCRVRYGDGIVGNAFTTPMADIIASEEYKTAIKLGKSKKYVNYCQYCS